MENDRLTRIQYSAKAASIDNYWKKMIGETRGIKRLNGMEKKQAFETDFMHWAESDAGRKAHYSQLLPAFGRLYANYVPLNNAYTYLTEGLLGIEVVRFANGFNNLVKQCKDKSKTDADISKLVEQLKSAASAFHKNYNIRVDAQVFDALMTTYTQSCDKRLQVPLVMETIQSGYRIY